MIVLGGVAIVWAATWSWLTTDVRRRTMLEGCGVAPELELEAAEPVPTERTTA